MWGSVIARSYVNYVLLVQELTLQITHLVLQLACHLRGWICSCLDDNVFAELARPAGSAFYESQFSPPNPRYATDASWPALEHCPPANSEGFRSSAR